MLDLLLILSCSCQTALPLYQKEYFLCTAKALLNPRYNRGFSVNNNRRKGDLPLRRFLIMTGFALEGRTYYLRSVFPRKEVFTSKPWFSIRSLSVRPTDSERSDAVFS